MPKGRRSGPVPAALLLNRFAIALASAIRLVGNTSRHAASALAIAWLDGDLVIAVKPRGMPFLATSAKAGAAGRARSILKRNRDDDPFLVASIGPLAAWLICRQSASEGCAREVAHELSAVDRQWPAVLRGLDAALKNVEVVRASRGNSRLPARAFKFLRSLKRAPA